MLFHLPRLFPPRRLGVIASTALVAACADPSTPSEPIATDHATHSPGKLATGNSEDRGTSPAGTPTPRRCRARAGTTCLNHPGMIDASRVGGSPQAGAPSHSHILDARGGGWRQTINIRVFNLEAWNQIAEAKTLAKVRELQGGNPSVGVPGVISADTPTNIYFLLRAGVSGANRRHSSPPRGQARCPRGA